MNLEEELNPARREQEETYAQAVLDVYWINSYTIEVYFEVDLEIWDSQAPEIELKHKCVGTCDHAIILSYSRLL